MYAFWKRCKDVKGGKASKGKAQARGLQASNFAEFVDRTLQARLMDVDVLDARTQQEKKATASLAGRRDQNHQASGPRIPFFGVAETGAVRVAGAAAPGQRWQQRPCAEEAS